MISSSPVGGFAVVTGLWVGGFVVLGPVVIGCVVCGFVGGACVVGTCEGGIVIPCRSSNACVP